MAGNNVCEADQFPEKRWGHSSVSAYSKLIIIGGYHGKFIFLKFELFDSGQYLGDIWVMDFSTLKYTKAEILSQFDPLREDIYLERAEA